MRWHSTLIVDPEWTHSIDPFWGVKNIAGSFDDATELGMALHSAFII
jgi:hypothetical protein